ncbi:hypothetical protein [Kaistia nematophila]|uniref:Secreted protein n=1 Tax=Kaistia nematophila TaxID=2994654 RepID=A0A9X3IK89_9HYPH|nr:hypothetical protein [Kaistia nematophila]MCX5569344.1 hypothetical protein [Kaistia nematophila]
MMIRTMKTMLHVGAIGLMLSVGAMGGANLAFANNDHGSHGGGSSLSGGSGWHGGSGGMSGGLHSGGSGDHHHPIGVVRGGLLFGPAVSGSGGTEFDDSGLPVTCGHTYTAHGAIGPRTCVATGY